MAIKGHQKWHGWLVIDKSRAMSSMQVTGAVRRLLARGKAGHAGTLDPLATGILPIAVGMATRTIPYVVAMKKQYLFTVHWGIATDTDDSDGRVINQSSKLPSVTDIKNRLSDWRGEVWQVPPCYSAIHVNGRRSYELARRQQSVALPPRRVCIDALEYVSSPSPDETVLRCHCGQGTYIRSLARDLGEALGCYGHVTSLRRMSVGCFDDSHAWQLHQLESLSAEAVAARLLPSQISLADAPRYDITLHEVDLLKRGLPLSLRCSKRLRSMGVVPQSDGEPSADGRHSMVVAQREDTVIALLRWRKENVLKTVCVFDKDVR